MLENHKGWYRNSGLAVAAGVSPRCKGTREEKVSRTWKESQCKQAASKGGVTFSGRDTANVRQPLEKEPKEQVLPYSISSWGSPLAKLTLKP